MLKRVLLSAVMALLMIPATASASMFNKDSTWYAGLGVYATTTSSNNASNATGGALDMDTATVEFGNLMLGYRPVSTFSDWGALRFEGEVSARGYEFDLSTGNNSFVTNDLVLTSYMANLLYEFHFFKEINPIIGAGAGIATGELGSQDSDSPAFAYQFTGGVTYTPAGWPQSDWSITYNYFMVHDLEFKSGARTTRFDEINAGSVNAAFRYFF